MSEDFFDHAWGMLDQDYLNKITHKYGTNNLDELAKAESKEMLESGVVGEFIKYKFKLKKD
jgi:hypothetical protein